MPRFFHGCIAALVMVWASSGCMIWKSTASAPSYETVTPDPNYDTPAAEKHHQTAVRILNACAVGNPGDYATAEDCLQKALVADVTYGPAHNSLGILYMFQRNYYLAAWEFEYAARLMPERIEPIYNLGRLYEEVDRVDLAIEHYEQALALAPHDPAVTASLASARLKKGESVDALRPLLEAVVLGDTRPEWAEWAHDHLGRHPMPVISQASSASSVAPDPGARYPEPGSPDHSRPRDDIPPRLDPPPFHDGPDLTLPRDDAAPEQPPAADPPPPVEPVPDEPPDRAAP